MIADATFLGVNSSFDGRSFKAPLTDFDTGTYVKSSGLYLPEVRDLSDAGKLV